MLDYSETSNSSHFFEDNHLYQKHPRELEPFDPNRKYINRSWTSSIESYGNAARKESYCLYNNGRRANFTLQLNLLRTYLRSDVPKLRKEMDSLFGYLRRKQQIVAYAVFEVTRDEFQVHPVDKVHLHFLIDTELSESELRDLFHRACKSAKYSNDDYRISKVENISDITDQEYKRLCRYLVKDTAKEWRQKNPILFKYRAGFRKLRMIGKFWENSNGAPTTKKEIWKSISEQMKAKNGVILT